MAIPVIRASGVAETSVVSPAILGQLVVVVSGAPILEWKWQSAPTPMGGADIVGVNGDFSNGLATIADPRFYCLLPGGYVFQIQVRNADGWSNAILVSLNALRGALISVCEEVDSMATIAAIDAAVALQLAPILAAMTSAADAGNSHTGALAGLATWTGTAKAWSGLRSIEVVGSADAAGTLFMDQSFDGGGTWAATMTLGWAVAAGQTFAFPKSRAGLATHYRLRFIAGAAALAALTITTTLTPKPVDSEIALWTATRTVADTVIEAAPTPIPIGARVMRVVGHRIVAPGAVSGLLNSVAYVTDAAAAQIDAMTFRTGVFETQPQPRHLKPDAIGYLFYNITEGVDCEYSASFYP